MSVEDKRGEALELVSRMAGVADLGDVVNEMDRVASMCDGDGEALAKLNAELGQIRVRVRQMQLALAPHMSAISAMDAARRKSANMTDDEKRAMAQLLSPGTIESQAEVSGARV